MRRQDLSSRARLAIAHGTARTGRPCTPLRLGTALFDELPDRFVALHQDGHEIPVDISLGPVEMAGDLLVAVILRDISHRKRVEWDLRGALTEVQRLSERLTAENVYLREEIESTVDFEDLVGQSAALRLILQQIEQVANTEANVLVSGETGTGKELVARAIHQHSPRKDRPLVKVDCAALPASLIESELLGYEKGAFTGAAGPKVCRFEVADGGTIFLDEIGEFPLELQSKLLCVLQEGVFWRLGSQAETTVDVRVIAATNRDLRQAMQEQRFRPDLYFRLAVFPIQRRRCLFTQRRGEITRECGWS